MRHDTERSRIAPWMLSILRLVAAFLFLTHGSQKLFNFPPSAHPMAHLPPLTLTAGILEFFGGVLLFLGIFTRPVAFILAGQMAVAYFMVHSPRGFLPIVNMGENATLYCFVFLYLAAAGGGPWSLERLFFKRP